MLKWFADRLAQTGREARKDERGFTLIELLVVVIIIGILAAIAIPTFLGQREGANDAAAESDLRNAAAAANSCYADNDGVYNDTDNNCHSLNTLTGSYDLNLSEGMEDDSLSITSTDDPDTWTAEASHPDGSDDVTYYFNSDDGTVTDEEPSE